MTTAQIRIERTGDIGAIGAVVEAAFGSPAEARLVEAIRSSELYIPELALVAELDGAIVGHVMISFATLVNDESAQLLHMLSPLAVAPSRQRRGIGAALVREVTTRADDAGAPLVILEGSPSFYGRLGFEPADPLGIHITLPSWAPPEAAQVLRLRRYDSALRGRVVYPKAFDDVTEH